MWIGGRRRGGGRQLSGHLQKTENETVIVHELSGFSFIDMTGANLEKALKQMEAIGYGKGAKRTLYHAILAPAFGETLTPEQRKEMVAYYAKEMGFVGHQYALVEHWKKGKQHFHLVFNIIHPETGKNHELKWTKRKEWRISRELEQKFGLKTLQPKGKAPKTSGMQRGKRTGIDPRKLRKEVTAIYHASMTAGDFVKLLEKSGYTLTRGRRDQLILVDKSGDTHGLMRLIEGKKLADLNRKFPELNKMNFRPHHELVKERKPVRTSHPRKRRIFINPRHVRRQVRHAYRSSKTGAAFSSTLGKQGYVLGRGRKCYAVVDRNGDYYKLDRLLGQNTAKGVDRAFPDLASNHSGQLHSIIRRVKAKRARSTKPIGTARTGTSHKALYPTKSKVTAYGGGATGATSPMRGFDAMLALFSKALWKAKRRREQEQQQQPMPMRPVAHGAMSEAQRIDLEAAKDGKITWAEYFRKWGGGQPSP